MTNPLDFSGKVALVTGAAAEKGSGPKKGSDPVLSKISS
jgi:hypothetical protein